MNRRLRRWLAVFAMAMLASGCAGREPTGGASFKGVVLQGRGTQLRLGWQPDSPVVRVLRPGVAVQVVASYDARDGRITGEPVSAPVAVAQGGTELLFSLADATRHLPAGPVCLRLRAGSRSLPLRHADQAGADPFARAPTDGFQYPGWREQVVASGRRREAGQARGRLASALDRAREVERSAEAQLAGFRAAGPSCAVAVAPGRPRAPSRNVVEPGSWTEEAELECSARFARFAGQHGFEAAELAQLIVDSLAAAGGETGVAARQVGAVIARRAPALAGFQSRFPRANPLGTSSETDRALADLKARGPQGVLQALLGISAAFDSCLPEVRDQFELAWNAWQSAQARNIEVELDAARRDARLIECQAAEAEAEKAASQREALAARLAAADAERAELDRLRPAADSGIVDLLAQRCAAEPAGGFAPPRPNP